MSIQRKWDHLTKDQRHAAVLEIIAHFESERGEEIGMIAAEDLLDFFQGIIGPASYAKWVEDARNVVREWLGNLEVDLEVLIDK